MQENGFENENHQNDNNIYEREVNDDVTYNTATDILKNNDKFFVNIPNSDFSPTNNENESLSDQKKFPINSKSVQNILKKTDIDPSELNAYILFSFTYVESETTTQNVTQYKIDYDKLNDTVDNYYFQTNDGDETKMDKYSVTKIMDMLNLSPNERIPLINFYETEQNVVSYGNKKNLLNSEEPKYSEKLKTPQNKKLRGVKKPIENNNNDDDNDSLIKEVKKTTKDKKQKKKKIIKTTKKTKILNPKPKDDFEIQNENELAYYGKSPLTLKDPYNLKNLKKSKRKSSVENNQNFCYYPFIIRKLPEHENYPMYVIGSIPQIGNWDPTKALPMDEEIRNDETFYTKYVKIHPIQFPFEYKYFYVKDDEINWVGMPYDNFQVLPQFYDMTKNIKKKIISFLQLNVRYLNETDGINIWENRKRQLINLLLNFHTDIVFFQEITKIQYHFIDKYLNSVYEFVGVYRDSTDASEKCSICYNIVKYTLIDWGQFWLSSTPDIPGSNDFDNFFPRICTWVILKQVNGIQLLFMNIHLDHVNLRAHMPCIRVAIEEGEKLLLKFPDIKFIFMGGCFYCEEDDPIISFIKQKGFNEVMFENTYHKFTGWANNHWDYLFWMDRDGYNGLQIKDSHVLKKEGTIDESSGLYISDHFPVFVEFVLNE